MKKQPLRCLLYLGSWVDREGGMVWKRLYSSLKQQRDPFLHEFFEAELAHLKQMANQTEIDLYDFDETGLHLNPSVPYA